MCRAFPLSSLTRVIYTIPQTLLSLKPTIIPIQPSTSIGDMQQQQQQQHLQERRGSYFPIISSIGKGSWKRARVYNPTYRCLQGKLHVALTTLHFDRKSYQRALKKSMIQSSVRRRISRCCSGYTSSRLSACVCLDLVWSPKAGSQAIADSFSFPIFPFDGLSISLSISLCCLVLCAFALLSPDDLRVFNALGRE